MDNDGLISEVGVESGQTPPESSQEADLQLPSTDQIIEDQPQEPQPPAYVTQAELDSLLEQRLRNSMQGLSEYIDSRVQSWADKTVDRLAKDVEKKFAAVDDRFQRMKNAGYPVTEEMVKQEKDRIVQETLRESNQEAEFDPRNPADVKKINEQVDALYSRYGMIVDPDKDPEAKLVDQSSGPAFVKTLEVALAAKKVRLGQVQQVSSNDAGSGGFGGPVPPAKGANPIANITDPDELFNIAIQRMAKQ